MYALIHRDYLLSKDEYVKVFDTYDEAYKVMRREFFRHVAENDLDVRDGDCCIERFCAYDSPDASANEWHINEVEDCTKRAVEERKPGSAMTWREFIAELQRHPDMLDKEALLYLNDTSDIRMDEPLPLAGVAELYEDDHLNEMNELYTFLWDKE